MAGEDPWRAPATGRVDAWAAGVSLVLGFLFVRWVLFVWSGWGVALYTLLFCAAVTLYLRHRGRRLAGEARFWLAILLLTGVSFALWSGRSLSFWRLSLLFGAAVYWVLMAAGATVSGRTSDWLPYDLLRGMLLVPLGSCGHQLHGLAQLRPRYPGWGRRVWPIALGAGLAALFIAVISPLLLRADAGGFAALLQAMARWTRWQQPAVSAELVIQLMLAIPSGIYIFGLVAGNARDRGDQAPGVAAFSQLVDGFRLLPVSTVLTMLALVSATYVAFMGSQFTYFFSAFLGERPAGWQLYAEYARRGFFELCFIAVLNFSLLALARLGVERTGRQHPWLDRLTRALAALTLLLLATAFSKVALYIGQFGLTVQRILPSVFLVWLAIVWGAVAVARRPDFSIMRLAALAGAVLFCGLCLVDPDGLATRYNARRYLNGTLESFDVNVLSRAGPAGVPVALQLYQQTDDPQLRRGLAMYLGWMRVYTAGAAGTMRDTLQHAWARRRLAGLELPAYPPAPRGSPAGP